MSMRFTAAINKPGFNPLGTQTSTTTYYPYLYGFGINSSGQLGTGNTTNYSSPVQIGTLSTWGVISNIGYSAISIKTDGTLWTWGNNQYGQLGLNNTTYYSSPKQIGALTTWSTVSNGAYFITAIKTDGTLWSWGNNPYGQLGLGNQVRYSSPKQVGSLTNWSKVSNGVSTSYAIKTDGTLWSWGYGWNGALGLGNITDYYSPKQVGALTNWLSVAASCYQFCLAIKTDGTLWSWGNNYAGQLGLGNTTYFSSPKQVGLLTNWSSISSGYGYAVLANKTDGTLWSWGNNSQGQLGLGNRIYYSSPKQIGALTTWSSSSMGAATAGAIKTDGTLWTWGQGNFGALGLGNTSRYSSPKQVGSLTTWLRVSSGNYFTLAELY